MTVKNVIWTLTVCALLLTGWAINPVQAEESEANIQNPTPISSPTSSPLASQPKTPASVPNPDAAGTGSETSPEISPVTAPDPLAAGSPPAEAPTGPTAGQTTEAPVSGVNQDTTANAPAADSDKESSAAESPKSGDTETVSPAAQAAPVQEERIRFTVVSQGKSRQASIAVTPKMTVGQAMVAAGFTLGALDRCVPEVSAVAKDGMVIRHTRVEKRIEKRYESIPAEVRYQPTSNLKPGTRKTVQTAAPGKIEVTEQVWVKDGKVTSRQFVSRRISQEPRHQIIALGTKPHILPNRIAPHRRYALAFRGGSPRDRVERPALKPADPGIFMPIRSLTVTSTGYSAGPAGGAIGNWTATGVRCTYGAVAVDPRVIPLGSRLFIEGYGYGFACDTGGAIRGKHIDLAFDSPRQAFAHGRRKVKVWILAPA